MTPGDAPVRALVVDDEPLARERVLGLLAARPDVTVVGSSVSGPEAAADILHLRPELVFLDIQMPEMDGFEVLEAVADEVLPCVVFITAYDEHALRAFEVHALDYLLKPIDAARFDGAVNRAVAWVRGSSLGGLPDLVEQVRAERPSCRIAARSGRTFALLRPEEVESVEAAGNYLRLSTDTGEYLVRSTLKAMEARLAGHGFLRIHRSTLVNGARIVSLTALEHGEHEVGLRGGRVLRASRSSAPRLRELRDL